MGLLLGGGSGSSKPKGGALLGGGGAVVGDDVEERLSLLEQQAAEFGARAPEQDSPGLFRRVVDVLSRPNYAIAGAAEELFTERGGGGAAALKRAGREFFSGIGGLKGDKEGFAQVMEQSGVKEWGEFSDIAPLLYSETGEGWRLQKGGVLDPTGRGAVGLVGDIALDPTTYLTAGAAGAVKFTGKSGTKFLNKVGKEAWQQTQAKYAPEMAKALGLTDELARNKALREVRDRAADEFEASITPTMLDKGGVKWAGRTVVPGETIRKLGADTVAALERVPGGERTIGVMSSAWDKSRAGLNAIFSAFPKLADAPAGMKARAIQLHRNFVDTAGSVSSVLNAEAADIGKAYDALVKADPNIGRKFYEVREGTGQHVLTAEQQSVYDRVVALHDKMEKHALDTGVLGPEDLLEGGYFHHSYLNTPEDFAAVADAAKRTIPSPSSTAKFQRERPFKTYAEAERISRDMNIYGQQARAAGVNATIYPELKPNYDVMQNLYSYIHQFSDAVARKQWADDIVRTWGVEVDPALAKAAYDVATPIPVKPKERWMLDRVFDGFKTLREMGEDLGMRETSYVARTHEMSLAARKYREVADSAPLEYMDRKVLKSADEIAYYRRQGYDVFDADGNPLDYGDIRAANKAGALLQTAKNEVRDVLRSAPLDYKETVALKSADEAGHYARRGYEITDEAGSPVTPGDYRLAQQSKGRLPDARRDVQAILRDAPLEYVERQAVRNADEVRYFRRRGWEIVDDGERMVAYKLKPVSGAKQQSWRDRLASATAKVERLESRAKVADQKLTATRIVESTGPEQQRWRDRLAKASAKVEEYSGAADMVKGELFAEKFIGTTGTQQQRWRSKLAAARRDLDASAKNSRRYITSKRGEEGMDRLARVGLKMLPRMSDDGKREFFRELFTRVNSPSQYADVVNRFQGYDKFFPNPKGAVVQGAVDPHWTWMGERAKYVQKTGGLYGDKTYMLPAHIADDFENVSSKLLNLREMKPAVRAMFNGFDRFNNTFKTGVYTFWPASAFRDIYNNVAQSFLDVGIGALARPMETARVLFGDGKVVLNGIEYDAKALKALAGEYGVVDKSGRSFIQMTGEKQFAPTGRMAKLVAKRAQIENWTRVQLWLNNIHRGLDPRDAADKVREFLFAYNELNPIEREVFRRAIPFYTFPRKAIALHLKALKETPGRLSAELKPFRGREDENSQLTSWDGQAFKLRLDRDGKTVHTITGIDLPIKTLDTLWRGDLKRTANGILGMFSPILKAPIELGTGRRMFDAKPLDRAGAQMLGRGIEWLNPPKAVKNWLGYAKEYDAAGRPKYSIDGEKSYILFQSWALSRVLSTSERQFNQFADDPNWAAVFLDLLTGLRYREFNMDEQQTRRYEERIRQLEQSLVERGARKRLEKTFAPKRPAELQ